MQSTPSRESTSDKKEKASTSRHQFTETSETTTHNEENEEEESGQLSPTPPEKTSKLLEDCPEKPQSSMSDSNMNVRLTRQKTHDLQSNGRK